MANSFDEQRCPLRYRMRGDLQWQYTERQDQAAHADEVQFLQPMTESQKAVADTLQTAIAHLEKVLNGCRSHAEQQAADKAAREFLSGLV